LTAADAERLNEIFRRLQLLERMTVIAPLTISRPGGIPVIGGSDTGVELFAWHVTASAANGTYLANLTTLNASSLVWTDSNVQAQIRGFNNETLTVGNRYGIGCQAEGFGDSNLSNLAVYAVTVGGNTTITGNSLGNFGRVANGNISSGALGNMTVWNVISSSGGVFATANVINYVNEHVNLGFFQPGQPLAIMQVPIQGGGTLGMPITICPADGTGNQGYVSNITQRFLGLKTAEDGLNVTKNDANGIFLGNTGNANFYGATTSSVVFSEFPTVPQDLYVTIRGSRGSVEATGCVTSGQFIVNGGYLGFPPVPTGGRFASLGPGNAGTDWDAVVLLGNYTFGCFTSLMPPGVYARSKLGLTSFTGNYSYTARGMAGDESTGSNKTVSVSAGIANSVAGGLTCRNLDSSACVSITLLANSPQVEGYYGNGSLAFRLPGNAGPGSPNGTVTSVGLSMPAGFSVAGSPVTGAGTLTVTLTDAGAFRSSIDVYSIGDVDGLIAGLQSQIDTLNGCVTTLQAQSVDYETRISALEAFVAALTTTTVNSIDSIDFPGETYASTPVTVYVGP
jgi:hypothetical protein